MNLNPDQYIEQKTAKAKKGDSRMVERLIQNRTVLISTEINDEVVDRIFKNLILMEQEDASKPIDVYINSPGGGADSGFAIYDMFRFIKPPVRTIVSGICASAAVIIFLGGRPGSRYSLPNSRFMLHEPRYLSTAYGQASDLAIVAKELLRMKDRYNKIVADATGKPLDKITDDSKRDFWLDSQEALDYGLVNKIIAKNDEIK
jgi:ATP-dependent Clp protease, protease subunit